MSKRPFHLAWFISKGHGPKGWRQPRGGPNAASWVKPDLLGSLAQSLERAAFDYVMIEDSSNIPYTYRNSHDTYVRYAVDSPKLDPSVLAPFLILSSANPFYRERLKALLGVKPDEPPPIAPLADGALKT